ncbi:MAG TPA: hypothetical protein VMZ00_08350 [Sporichthya sp.]|nr:hypothetical protein [Sporichthya sp.]
MAKRRLRRSNADHGYALLSVVGFGTAIVLTVGVVGAYAVQSMQSSGRTQGSNAAIQAAQAGVDDFVAKLTADPGSYTAPTVNAAWQPIAGSTDGVGTLCVGTDATLPPNCPRFKYTAVQTATGWTVSSTGKSRGQERTVQVPLKKRAFTDYLYYSESEAADPNDRFAYPVIPALGLGGAPANCGNKAWAEGAAPARPATGCVVPKWRAGDTTDGSRVHTRDVFGASGSPTFNSRVSAGIPGCASASTSCVTGGSPIYPKGNPSYADDLRMPTGLLSGIAAAAATSAGCTYTGPTRIKFGEGANAGKMQVWSPMSTFATTAERDRCLGGAPQNLIGLSLTINVRGGPGGNAGIINGLVGGLLSTTCTLLNIGCPATTNLSLNNILSGNLLGDLTSALPLFTPPWATTPSAIYVKDVVTPPAGLTTQAQCLLASAAGLGLYSGDVVAALNSGLLAPADCRDGDLRISGKYTGKTTIGTDGGITILSDLTATNPTDQLGLVAQGPVEVYSSLQCVLSIGTCMSLDSLSTVLPSLLTLINGSSATKVQLTNVLHSLGVDKPITVEAAVITNSRFGVQLPLLSPVANVGLLDQLISLGIDPPKLRLKGSLAQKYKGIVSADLLKVGANGLRFNNLASVDVDMGYNFEMVYDSKYRNDPTLLLPAPATTVWDPQSFAEVTTS